MTLDDMKRFMESHHSHRGEVARAVCKGEIPWMLSTPLLRPASLYWNWHLRTQPGLVDESAETRGGHTIYATNGFNVARDGSQRFCRVAIKSVPTAIVTDMS